MPYKNNKLVLPQEIYATQLKKINAVALSQREIDIIACILSGRSAKGTAHFLSISFRTVQVHTYNAMKKLECTSRESMIALIERSDQFIQLKEYYLSLLTYGTFQKCLKEVAKLGNGHGLTCLVVYWQTNGSTFFNHLKTHLTLAGISVLLEGREKDQSLSQLIQEAPRDAYTIYAISPVLLNELQELDNGIVTQPSQDALERLNNILLLLPEREESKEIPKDFSGVSYINTNEHKNYYLLVFEILKKLHPHANLNSIFENFKQQCEFSSESLENKYFQKKVEAEKGPSLSFLKKGFLEEKKWYFLILFIIAMSALGLEFFLPKGENELKVAHTITKQLESPVRSDLILPSTSTLLYRPDLMRQIDDKFKKQGNGIQTVALVGIGGSGKTTLAREYARSQKEPVIWEMNAETHSSLMESFENLASGLSRTEEDKGLLRELNDINKPSEREKKIVGFVKGRLKLRPNWFLIYDNVEKFTDIQKYFPLDPETWGQGRVLLTTQDSTIQNHKQVDSVIFLRELDVAQKLNLFIQIISNGEDAQAPSIQTEETKSFLEKIPPFPLDISIAAYYIKATGIWPEKYVEHLNEYGKDFASMEENLLKELGDYTRTRYSIITLSLDHLIKAHTEFADLLFFISLLNSQNIPRSLLRKYKNDAVVDNFVYHLKKYSLITNETLPTLATSAFSIHRSTQKIILEYLSNKLSIANKKHLINSIVKILENYSMEAVAEENFDKMLLFATHGETFLNHTNLLTEKDKIIISGELSHVSYMLSQDLKKFMQITEKYITQLKSHEAQDDYLLARLLSYLGICYWREGDFKKSQSLLEQSTKIYMKNADIGFLQVAQALVYLGMAYTQQDYGKKAQNALEQSISLYYTHGYQNRIETAFALTKLGELQLRMGQCQMAQDSLLRSIDIYKKNEAEGCTKAGWAFFIYSCVLLSIEEFEKAKIYGEQAYSIYKKHYSENAIFLGAGLRELGSLYSALNEFQQAQPLLKKSLQIYSTGLGDDNIKTLWALYAIGNNYRRMGKQKEAKEILNICLKKFEVLCGRNSLDVGLSLHGLGRIALAEESDESATNYLQESRKIFQTIKTFNLFLVCEDLAELYLKKSKIAYSKKECDQSRIYKKQAVAYLFEAFDFLNKNFPMNSKPYVRIREKLKKLEE